MGSGHELQQPLLVGGTADGDVGDVASPLQPPAPPAASLPAVAAAAADDDDPVPESLGPLGSRNPLSAASFAWVSPLLRRGSTQEQLHQRDLYALPPHLLPAACGQRLLSKWRQVRRRRRHTAGGL